MRIAVVGGGPGGLFFATLARRLDASHDVTVLERNSPDDTYGFGVVFSDATMATIDAVDPVLRQALATHGVHWDEVEVRLKGESARCGGNGMAAISRRTLLQILQRQAVDAGVAIRFETEAHPDALEEYDLVVAADGANSRMREANADAFAPSYVTSSAKFIWFGTTARFDGLTFVFERGEHGVFAAHAYPFDGQTSTFIVETDEQSWLRAGLSGFDQHQLPGVSDEHSRDYLEALFAEHLDGGRLLMNNSRWSNFRTRTAKTWWHGSTVLLGDAAHTAHFSVGSGTKMAMEDAIALASSLDTQGPDLGATFRAYEAQARPTVERIQGSAGPSLHWWENFGRTHDALDPWQFSLNFMTRSMSLGRLARRAPRFVESARRRWAEGDSAGGLERPLTLGTLPVARRKVTVRRDPSGRSDIPLGSGTSVPLLSAPPTYATTEPWAFQVDVARDAGLSQVVERVSTSGAGATLVAVGGSDRGLALRAAEDLRLGHDRVVLLIDSEMSDDEAETAVLAGRVDLVATDGGPGEPRDATDQSTSLVTPWPDEVAAEYVAAGYWLGERIDEYLWRRARSWERVAVIENDVRLNYADLLDRADAAASRLVDDLGLVPGDRIVIQLPNIWEFVVLTLACLRSGLIPVMALPAHRRVEISHLVRLSGATALAVPGAAAGFDHEEMALDLVAEIDDLTQVLVAGARVREGHQSLRDVCAPPTERSGSVPSRRPPASDSRSVALFLLSGGTTGLPKLIARTHDDYLYNARRSAEVSAVDESTVYLVALPAEHNFPLACPGILGTLLNAGTVVMVPSAEPARAFEWIAREGVTHTSVVPAIAQRWLDHHRRYPSGSLASLRVLQVGGARLADEVARRVVPELGCALQQVFGMAEGLLNYTRLDESPEVAATTQGRPISPGDEVLLVDEEGRAVPAGTPGSLLTRGPYTPRGYYNAPEHNRRAFTDDGWYRSGDICRWDPESGNLIVEGRDKDMINRGGEKISAEEIENLVYGVPGVVAVAAVAMPDPLLGERICIYVVEAAGFSLALEAIRSSIESAGVARYKLPEHLVIVDELPTTRVGKVDKVALRADIASRLDDTDHASIP